MLVTCHRTNLARFKARETTPIMTYHGGLREFGTKIHGVFQGVFEDFKLGDFEACESGLGNETETNETLFRSIGCVSLSTGRRTRIR